MIMKLKKQRPGPKGAVEPVKKKCTVTTQNEVIAELMKVGTLDAII
jgi:hypothetical protein